MCVNSSNVCDMNKYIPKNSWKNKKKLILLNNKICRFAIQF